MNENRKHIRLKAPIGVVYRLINQKKPSKYVLTLAINISGGGVSFVAKDELRQGDLVELQIHIPNLEEPIQAVGEIVWFFSPTGQLWKRKELEAGARFRDISPQDLNKLLEYVHTVGIG